MQTVPAALNVSGGTVTPSKYLIRSDATWALLPSDAILFKIETPTRNPRSCSQIGNIWGFCHQFQFNSIEIDLPCYYHIVPVFHFWKFWALLS